MRSPAHTASRHAKRRLKDEATLPERTLMVALDVAREPYSFQYVVETEEADAGYYIVDFYLPKRKVLLELDGARHFSQQGHWNDRLRTEAIERARPKLPLIRLENAAVTRDAAGVVRYLRTYP